MAPFTRPTFPDTMTFMDSILDPRSPTTDHVFKTSMALSTDPSTTVIEPLPHLDYFLINRLVAIARPHLNKHQLKRMDYLVDARRSFYEGHAKFQVAYRELLDADACAEILDKKFEELSQQLADALILADNKNNENNDNNNSHQAATTVASLRTHISVIEAQRQTNYKDLRIRLDALNAKTKIRQHVSAWFSELKVVFLRDEMPWLVAMTKQCYAWAVAQQRSKQSGTGSVAPAPSSHVQGLMDRVDSIHCHDDDDDEGDMSMAEGGMGDFGVGMGGDEGEGEGEEEAML